jgi:hypothetical protein
VIATTGEEFSDFAPYLASVNDAGTVVFQAALDDGRTGVFTGRGAAVLGPSPVARVTTHPDVNNAGDMSFYGDLPNGRQAVFLIRNREVRSPSARTVGAERAASSSATTLRSRRSRTRMVPGAASTGCL